MSGWFESFESSLSLNHVGTGMVDGAERVTETKWRGTSEVRPGVHVRVGGRGYGPGVEASGVSPEDD